MNSTFTCGWSDDEVDIGGTAFSSSVVLPQCGEPLSVVWYSQRYHEENCGVAGMNFLYRQRAQFPVPSRAIIKDHWFCFSIPAEVEA